MSGESLIYFNGKFWLGLFSELKDGNVVRVGTYVFGAEPKASEIDAWLAQGSPGLVLKDVVADDAPSESGLIRDMNPKRRLREARREQEMTLSESKAQKAMRQVIELNKAEGRKDRRRRTKEQKALEFALKQKKKKSKHRGR